jgi:hypothetical protein
VATFDELVREALDAPFSGWDFSWLAARSSAGPLPWSYRREVARRATAAGALLDMGTGGGERLSRLRPLGIPVVQDEGAPDNTGQTGNDPGRLPFRDGVFGLVANRHEAFRAAEVSRVLAPGTFITEQVDFHSHDGLCTLAGLDVPQEPDSWLPLARQQVQDAGLAVAAAIPAGGHQAVAGRWFTRTRMWRLLRGAGSQVRPGRSR